MLSIACTSEQIVRATYLRTGAGEIRTEHDHPWCMIIEVLSAGLETIFKQLDVSTATVTTFLILDFVLNNQGLVFEVNCFMERSGDCMVSSLVLSHEAQVAFDDRSCWFFDLPFADVAESLGANGCFLGGF
jgi:hypothetical protein